MLQIQDSFNWKKTNSKILYPVSSKSGALNLRPWQKKCFEFLHDKRHSIINTPTGSGKSCVISSLVYSKLKNNSLKAIIVVPETIVASSFSKEKQIQLCSGEVFTWKPSNNLCNANYATTIGELDTFLTNNPYGSDFNDRVIIVCRQTLVLAYEQNRDKDYWENIVFVIDEAHRILQDESLSISEEQASLDFNKLGVAIDELIEKNQVILVTATFFRGDRKQLLSNDNAETFFRFNMPYDQWLEQMKYFESFSYNFVVGNQAEPPDDNYLGTLENCINDLFVSNHKKIIIYIPHRSNNMATKSKNFEVDQIVRMLAKQFDAIEINVDDHGIIELKDKQGKTFRILDLVTEENRDIKKQWFSGNVNGVDINKDPNLLDCIISLNMVKEGADWEYANGMVITGIRDSLTDIIQMIGRVIRDKQGKKSARILHLLPSTMNIDMVDSLNEYFKIVALSMLMENITNPISNILTAQQNAEASSSNPEDESDSEEELDTEDDSEPEENDLENFLDSNQIQSLLTVVQTSLMAQLIQEENPSIDLQQFIPSVVEGFLENRDIKVTYEELQSISQQVIAMVVRHSLRIQSGNIGVDLSNLDWNMIVQADDPLYYLQRYISQNIGAEAMKTLKERWINGEIESNKKVHEVCKFYEQHKKYPSKNSKDASEKSLGMWLSAKRQAAKGKGRLAFYPSDQAIAESYNLKNLFQSDDKEALSNTNVKELCEYIKKNGKFPNKNSKDTEEKLLGQFLQRKKNAKNGKKTRVKFYPSDQKIANQYGLPNLFDLNDPETRSNKLCKEVCIWIITNQRMPKKLSKDKVEKSYYGWLINKQRAFEGHQSHTLYDSDIEIAKKYKLPDLFDRKSKVI